NVPLFPTRRSSDLKKNSSCRFLLLIPTSLEIIIKNTVSDVQLICCYLVHRKIVKFEKLRYGGLHFMLKRTPIYPLYENLGAKTVDFGGWDLPVQFSGIMEEHRMTREKATLFDVSH